MFQRLVCGLHTTSRLATNRVSAASLKRISCAHIIVPRPPYLLSTAPPTYNLQRRLSGSTNRGQEIRSPDNAEDKPEKDQDMHGKPSKAQQLKTVFKEYGAVGVTFHIGISLLSLGMFYVALSSGIDMTSLLFKIGFSESVVQSKMAAGTSTFVLAYAIHKMFAPVRISITVVSVPLIVRYFRKVGLFKPPASSH
ncbi:protein FAM210B, mitochondrial [Erpetoichthys calabaricus]|uniref:Family with sequence similarity 210 member B n=1 Tax=Erpetoichthys calabaricus TaxID=27687 RepID=A0A8C4S6Q3_ERPCA|nr:protein FAM210B, mitochondrial [Erpetoichthys calabaricus]